MDTPGEKYQASREDIITLISTAIKFENPQAIWAALSDFQEKRSQYAEDGRKLKLPDFVDALIINKAKLIAKQSNENLAAVYTFDTGPLRIAGTCQP